MKSNQKTSCPDYAAELPEPLFCMHSVELDKTQQSSQTQGPTYPCQTYPRVCYVYAWFLLSHPINPKHLCPQQCYFSKRGGAYLHSRRLASLE